jgi:hypothetical protein
MTPGEALAAILERAERRGWAGPDPYDALLSVAGRAAMPFGSLPRIAAQQAPLRVPALRSFFRAPPTVNAKALGLFLGAALRGRHVLGEDRARALARALLGELRASALPVSGSESAASWGYPFPWQSRWLWAPIGTPNAVVTATVGWHLFECADALGDRDAATLGTGAAQFIARGLRRTRFADGAAATSYTPRDNSRIINVSALGARLLSRALAADAEAYGDVAAQEDARQLVRGIVAYVVETQRSDGSWPYAPDPRGGWVDSFHTGYILESLLDLRARGERIPEDTLARGFAAYATFFDADGGGRLFAEAGSPYDGHSTAQGVLTYAALARAGGAPGCDAAEARERALRIAAWALDKLWLPKRGFFAYRVNRGARDEREFTRWVQAWMALAMATAADLEAASHAEAGSMDREHTRAGV